MRWAPRNTAKNKGRKKILVTSTNKKGVTSTKELWHYTCQECGPDKWYRDKEISMDHRKTVVPLTGWVSFDDYIDNMFCEEENFQRLCDTCHDAKTSSERAVRTSNRKSNKKVK